MKDGEIYKSPSPMLVDLALRGLIMSDKPPTVIVEKFNKIDEKHMMLSLTLKKALLNGMKKLTIKSLI